MCVLEKECRVGKCGQCGKCRPIWKFVLTCSETRDHVIFCPVDELETGESGRYFGVIKDLKHLGLFWGISVPALFLFLFFSREIL